MERIGDRRDQGARIGMARVLEDLLPAALLDDAAEIHHRHPVAHMLDHAEVVADHDVGQAHLVLELEQQVDDLGADRDVERRHRLVADHQLGLQDQGAGDADALALAARELVRVAVGVLGAEADLGHHVHDAGLDLGLVPHAVQAQRIGQRPAHGLARVERGVRVLEDHLHRARHLHAIGRRVAGDLLAADMDAAFGRQQQAHDGECERGLAAARFAHQPQALAGLHVERDTVDRLQGLDAARQGAADLEMDGEAVEGEQGLSHGDGTAQGRRPAAPSPRGRSCGRCR